jgi:Tfp pilus assembly protein PilV
MNSKDRGISIIEIVIAAAIIGISVIGIINSLKVFLSLSMKNTNEAQAGLLLEETLEVLQYSRDKGWTSNIKNLNKNVGYYILWNGIDYSATTTPQVDDGTRKVSVEIAWKDGVEDKKVNSEFLIHNVYQN